MRQVIGRKEFDAGPGSGVCYFRLITKHTFRLKTLTSYLVVHVHFQFTVYPMVGQFRTNFSKFDRSIWRDFGGEALRRNELIKILFRCPGTGIGAKWEWRK